MYRLRDHLGYGLIDQEPVFLDLTEDRYFQIDDELAQTLADLRLNDGDDEGPGPVRLREAGLIVETSGQSRVAPAAAPTVKRDLLQRTTRMPSPRQIAETSLHVTRALVALRFINLANLIVPRGQNEGEAVGDMVSEAALVFEASRSRVPIARRCLLDALALSSFLRRRGLPATLVFGVTLHPFSAHCWLQHDDCLLTGGIDTLHGFTPVLAV